MKSRLLSVLLLISMFSGVYAQKDIEVVVHRGANALAPENTVASADSALAHGAKWIEVDVRVSKDGVMYNLHDDILDRTTNGKGNIAEWLSVDINRLDAGAWYAEKFRGLRVPTIEEMIDSLEGRAYIYFDVKPGSNVKDLVNLVRRKNYTHRSFFWFAKEDMLREFVALAPEMKVKVNAADIQRLEYWKTICTPAIVEVNADKITLAFVEYCHNHQIKIMVGAQGESLDDYRKAIETGADMINLDKPELFEQLRSVQNAAKDVVMDALKKKLKTFDISKYGAVSDGATNNAAAIQACIDKASASKHGGIVRIGAGRWLTGMIEMKSNVMLHLDKDAVLLGSINPYDYDTTDKGVGKRGDEDVHMGLIVSRGARNIAITGEGTIDAQGLELALAIDSLHHIGEKIDANYNVKRQRPGTRPKLLFLSDSEHIMIEGVKFRNSAGWGLSLHGSRHISIDNINVYNRAYWNNDGIDINDCQHVSIKNCDINSADDGICLKSDDEGNMCSDISIEKCTIRSSASAVKFGTSSYGGFRNISIRNIKVKDTFRSAIALESVDGAVLENVLVDGVEAVNTGNPLFVRLGARHGDAEGRCKGVCRNITIRNVKAQVPFGRPDEAYDLRGPEVNYFHNPWPSSIAGLPGHEIENITLENIDIEYPGRATRGMAYVGLYRAAEVPENADGYPEFSMFGELPSWAFYIRHVRNIAFRNVNVRLKDSDFRPAFVFDDVEALKLENVNQPESQMYFVKTNRK